MRAKLGETSVRQAIPLSRNRRLRTASFVGHGHSWGSALHFGSSGEVHRMQPAESLFYLPSQVGYYSLANMERLPFNFGTAPELSIPVPSHRYIQGSHKCHDKNTE
ncbi:uncharacterized protein LOC142564237 isoform X2 [Dermacentor variabilis]|uniref:uncharacterized protein LOC142564237 isoform X2 n=1 Tax=Dermacentor variabilis TaxID=34621 RepID=UPI003F5B7E79